VSCAGGEPQRELPEMTDVFAANLSPDGKTLVCLRGIQEKDRRLKSIWISSPLGAPPRKYSSAPFETEPILLPNYLKFSPDGLQIGYSYFSQGGGGGFQLLDWPDGPNAKTRRIFQNQTPSPPSFDWLPDSRHMIISTQGNLWLGDVKTGELMRFTKPIAGAEYHPSVSPDGKRVVISVQTSDYDIAEIPLDGGIRAWPLLATSGSEEYPSRSRSGLIAFVGNPPGGYGIWLRSGQGDWQRLIVTRKDFPDDKGGNFHFAAISPDGFRVAYSRTNPIQAKIWISPTAGGRPAPAMPDIDQREIACSWSPNSAALACVISKKGIYSLGVIQVGSKNPPRYIPAPTLRTAPAWSPDDQWIAYGSSEPSLILVSPDGKKSRKLPSPVAPSNQRFVLVWSRDATTIYVADSHGVSARLYAVDIKSGKSRQVADLGPDIDFEAPLNLGLSGYLAADGKSFVTNVVNSRSDLWIMEGFPQPGAERNSWLDALPRFFNRK